MINWKPEEKTIHFKHSRRDGTGKFEGLIIFNVYSATVILFDGEEEDSFHYTGMQTGKVEWIAIQSKVDSHTSFSAGHGKFGDEIIAWDEWRKSLPIEASQELDKSDWIYPLGRDARECRK